MEEIEKIRDMILSKDEELVKLGIILLLSNDVYFNGIINMMIGKPGSQSKYKSSVRLSIRQYSGRSSESLLIKNNHGIYLADNCIYFIVNIEDFKKEYYIDWNNVCNRNEVIYL